MVFDVFGHHFFSFDLDSFGEDTQYQIDYLSIWYNARGQDQEEIIQICEETLRERCDTSRLVEQQAELRTELEIITELMQRHITANAHMAMDQAEYQRQYDEYESRYNETQRRFSEIEARLEALTAKRGKLKGYLDMLRKQGSIRTFNETLWCGAVEQVRIKEDGTMRFIFKNGAFVEG